MGKKGKGNKLAKMSEEERARYLQLRADIEEEARRRKMQLINLYMKNKIKREEAFSRLNTAKLNLQWRTILRAVKTDELHHEAKELEVFTKEAVERKERIINRKLCELQIGEDQYTTLQNTHMDTVEKFVATQQERLSYFRNLYIQEKRMVLFDFKRDFNEVKTRRDRTLEQMECVMYQLEAKAEREAQENFEKYMNNLDDIKSDMQLNLENLTQAGEAKLEKLWLEYQQVLSNYMKNTESFYAEYMELKERDEESAAQIRENNRVIEKATATLANLKSLVADVEERCENKIQFYVQSRDDINEKFLELKQNVETAMKTGEAKFKLLSVESHQVLQYVRAKVKHGVTILQLANICRKYETDRERLFPYTLPLIPRQMFEMDEENLQQPPDEIRNQTFELWNKMEVFWRRVNTTAVNVMNLKREKKKLEAENARLRTQLQEYLVDLNISNGSNAHINDYLAKRPHSMRVDRQSNWKDMKSPTKKQSQSADVKRTRHLRPLTTCIEAHLTSAVRSEKLARGKLKLAKITTIVH